MNRANPFKLDFIFTGFDQMNSKNQKTLEAIFHEPTLGNICFADIETLILALGGTVTERSGSRVKIALKDEQWHCHRPHPHKEAHRYQVEEARELLKRIGLPHEYHDL